MHGTCAGEAAVDQQDAKRKQLELLEEAERTCQTATTQVKWSKPAGTTSALADGAIDVKAGLNTELNALSDNFAGLRKMVENEEVGAGGQTLQAAASCCQLYTSRFSAV